MGHGLKVYLRKLRRDEHFSFSFPATEAQLTPEVLDDYRMKAALTRFGKALAAQLRKRYPSLVGIEIHNLGFTMRYAKEDPKYCAHRKDGLPPPNVKPGHCGGCKLGRLPKKKAKKRKK